MIILKNNYSNILSDIKLIGVIPFEGNKYITKDEDMGSLYTVKMKDTGVKVPAGLESQITVYYTEVARPSQDLSVAANRWKRANQLNFRLSSSNILRRTKKKKCMSNNSKKDA